MSDTDLLDAAEALGDIFSRRSEEIEGARRIPPDVSAQMAEAGFFAMGVPADLGGRETPPPISVRVFERLAQGDAACAWVAFIGTTAGTSLAAVSEDAGRDIFAHPSTLVTGVFAPTGEAEQVDGGFRVTGRWQWGSGSENAHWITGGCRLMNNGEPLLDHKGRPRTHACFFKAEDVEFIDTWHSSGLCGTGSLDYRVRDLFVPDSHVAGFHTPARPAVPPLYAFPSFTFLALGIGAVCLGTARAAIDELVELATAKKRVGSSRRIAEGPYAQMRLAESEASLRSARAFFYDALDKAWSNASGGNRVSVDQRRELRLATTHAVRASADVVDRMYELGGGSSVYSSSRLQRCFRDVHVATQHIMVAPSTLETVGRLYFGLEANTAML